MLNKSVYEFGWHTKTLKSTNNELVRAELENRQSSDYTGYWPVIRANEAVYYNDYKFL